MCTHIVEGSALLVDLSSAQYLALGFERNELTDPKMVPSYEAKLMVERDFWTAQLFELLANFIAFDKIILDKRALEAFPGIPALLQAFDAAKLGAVISGIRFPVESYVDAWDQVGRLRKTLLEALPMPRKNKDKRPILENFFGSKETMGVDDPILCDLFDAKLHVKLADSNEARF